MSNSQLKRFGFFSAIDIIIYRPDKVGVQIKVVDGQNIKASELFEYYLDELKEEWTEADPVQAREVFSLWLVSDLLGKTLSFHGKFVVLF